MEPRRCWNCGAPLPAATARAVEPCDFCGAETRREEVPPTVEKAPVEAPRAARPPPPPSRDISPTDVSNGGTPWSKGCVAAAFLGPIILAVAIGGIVSASESCGSSSSSGSPSAASHTPKLNLGNLATAPSEFGWTDLDAPGFVGTYASFDPEANIAWAKTVGRAWKPDTILYRLLARRASHDGTVNIPAIPDASVEYRMMSPKCLEGYKSSTALVDPHTPCELFIDVKVEDGSPGVQVITVRTDSLEPELRVPECALTQAIAALDKAGKLPARPVYDADVHVFGDPSRAYGAKWNVSTIIPSQANIPVVDAMTCKVGW